MSDRIQILTHQGHPVLFVDHAGLTPERARDVVAEDLTEFVRRAHAMDVPLICVDVTATQDGPAAPSPGRQGLLGTADARGIKLSGGLVDALSGLRLDAPRIAFVGVHGLRLIQTLACLPEAYFASTREEALDWLALFVDSRRTPHDHGRAASRVCPLLASLNH